MGHYQAGAGAGAGIFDDQDEEEGSPEVDSAYSGLDAEEEGNNF